MLVTTDMPEKGIDLEAGAPNKFQDRLRIYGDVPVNTFSILC